MAKTEFSAAEIKAYFTDKKLYYYCTQAREKEREMRVHADGTFPEKLINERRPNEPETVLAYRKTIFTPKTKPYFSKVENTLQKIRRSSDWSIKYPDVSFDKIVEGEKMNDYAESHYPVFESVTNWAFSVLLRNYLIDANAVELVAPVEMPEGENEFIKPVATIFNSTDVIDYVDGDYCVLINKMGSHIMYSGKPHKSIYVITTERIIKYNQINLKGDYVEMLNYEHGLGMMPAFKLGGIAIDVYGSNILYDSRISGILPEFNEALREYSDLQAAKVLHLYPERWEYTQNECVNCKGSGQRIEGIGENACQVTCNTCQGQGYVATGPYSKMLIRPSSADQLQLPTPPAGFVEKDVEIIKVQEQSVKDHIYSALAAINFEFLTDGPMNQSGTAKEVDKDELNTMVHSIAEDLVRIIDKTYYMIALWRYSVQYTADEIYEMLPMISVPEKYDILSTKYYDEQITSAIKNKLNPVILNALEVSYATKAFNNDLDIAKHVGMVLKLDPLAGITEDDKMSRLSNEGITKTDYVVSSNINKFVAEAVETMPGFVELDIIKQKQVIYAMAEKQIAASAVSLLPMDDVEDELPDEDEPPTPPTNDGRRWQTDN